MHDAAYAWVKKFSTERRVSVLDIGGRNVNGTCRDLFPNARYVALDYRADDGVDIVADARSWEPDDEFDVVLCTEVFEHVAGWERIVETAHEACKPGGLFVVTTATHGRPPHSAVDGRLLRYELSRREQRQMRRRGEEPPVVVIDEWYQNVDSGDLYAALHQAGFIEIAVDVLGTDVRSSARRSMT